MSGFKRFLKLADQVLGTALLTLRDNCLDMAVSVVALQATRSLTDLTLPGPGALQSPWASSRLAARTVDGAVFEGQTGWQKLAIRKGLPAPGQKNMAVENAPHRVDGFSGVIASGYGKGTKTILVDQVVPVKVEGRRFFGRLNYHFHEADKAGPHFDLAVEGVEPGKDFEINIPNGPYKGRYTFIHTDKGVLVNPMKDRGIRLDKPKYQLKHEDIFEKVEADRKNWIIEQKLDGSLGNAHIHANRAIFRSHRDTGQSYYDRLPAIDNLENRSSFWLSRKLFPGPDLEGTVFQGEILHPDGASRASGILNALPTRAHEIQKLRGEASYHVWDIRKFKGRDVSRLPYAKRRDLMESSVKEIRQFNKNWQVVETCPDDMSVADFYQKVIDQPLPYGEGIILKPAAGLIDETTWFKVKQTELLDLEIIPGGFIEGQGRHQGRLGALVVRNPETGSVGEVGTGFTDFERDWIWQHQQMLKGAVVKVKAMEETSTGSFRAPAFHSFHEGKGSTEYGLLLYAESLAGGDQKEMMSTKHALIQAPRR